MKESQKHTIGRTDKIDFPEWGLSDVSSKIDSGAYSSVINCVEIKPHYKGDKHYVTFSILNHDLKTERTCEVAASKMVKNSFGQQTRYFVKTVIRLFEKNYVIELSLADRSSMKYPVLIGRKFLMDRFIIDVTQSNVSFKEKNKIAQSAPS